MQVAGRSALVAGGASGLGWATAQLLADAGGRVIVMDLPGSIERARTAPGADRVRFEAADVTDEAAVRAAVAVANERGDLSIVVNCAGIGDPKLVVAKAGAQEFSAFERVIRVNLLGTFNVIRLAGEAMIPNAHDGEERGVIINTASVAAYDGQIGQASYAASKGAVVSMTLPIAREFARHGIRVVTIAPGLFETPLLGELPEDIRAELGRQVPFPSRLGAPEEYARLAAAIIDNPMLNGETIRLDGAIRMAPR